MFQDVPHLQLFHKHTHCLFKVHCNSELVGSNTYASASKTGQVPFSESKVRF